MSGNHNNGGSYHGYGSGQRYYARDAYVLSYDAGIALQRRVGAGHWRAGIHAPAGKVDGNFTPTKFGFDLVEDATALDKMLHLDPDTRFDRLAANGFEPLHLDNVALLSEEWLNNPARARMHQLATEHAAGGSDILPLLEAWLFDDKMPQMQRMQQLLTRYNFRTGSWPFVLLSATLTNSLTPPTG